jgi:hypothetical protein
VEEEDGTALLLLLLLERLLGTSKKAASAELVGSIQMVVVVQTVSISVTMLTSRLFMGTAMAREANKTEAAIAYFILTD